MCGLAGYYALSERQVSHDQQIVRALAQSLQHRGPDGEGFWIDEAHHVAFAHRRLSIIDTSPAGAQPMHSDSAVIAFNGEIYNFKALRAELTRAGHVFTTQSDTEVILAAYERWGIACLDRLEGMFAFALYDKRTRELFLARDRIGVKPLYFSMQGEMLSFASEIKALWQMPWITKNIRLASLSHYLTFLAVPAPYTMFEQVYKLPAGFYAKASHGRLSFHEWYSPRPRTIHPTDEYEVIERLDDLMRGSIEQRMVSDVPVGVFLSGGVDSSLITAYAKRHAQQLKTFNVSFSDGPEYQERMWARAVADHVGSEHHELILNEQDAFNFFDAMVYHQDEPLGDSVCVPLYYVSKMAKQHGVSVVLMGEGADELFCGYPMYVRYLQAHRYWRTSQQLVPSVCRRMLFKAATRWYEPHTYKLGMMHAWTTEASLFHGGVQLCSPLSKSLLARQPLVSGEDAVVQAIYPGICASSDSYAIADYHVARFVCENPQADFYASMMYLELKHRLPELLLTRSDKMTMAAGVEGRVPFLDYRVVEYALGLSVDYKYRHNQTKYMLKKLAERYIPSSVIYRPKIGFTSPIARWFSSGAYFQTYLNDLLSSKSLWADMLNVDEIRSMHRIHKAGRADYAYHLWALCNLFAYPAQP